MHVHKCGYHIAFCNPRGIESPLKTNQFWHPGVIGDADLLLSYIHTTYGARASIFMVGCFLLFGILRLSSDMAVIVQQLCSGCAAVV
jgi:hypothetical protein